MAAMALIEAQLVPPPLINECLVRHNGTKRRWSYECHMYAIDTYLFHLPAVLAICDLRSELLLTTYLSREF